MEIALKPAMLHWFQFTVLVCFTLLYVLICVTLVIRLCVSLVKGHAERDIPREEGG